MRVCATRLFSDFGGDYRAKPRPASKSSTLRSDSGYFTYIIVCRAI